MFHVGVGAVYESENSPAASLRQWESRFSSDPLIFDSTQSGDPIGKMIGFPTRYCELKLFRDYAGLLEGVPFDILPAQRGCRILVLGVPVNMNVSQLISGSLEEVKYYSELRRSETSDSRDFNRSVLIVFINQVAADRFFRDWHLQFFDPQANTGAVCYLAFVDKLFVDVSDSERFQMLSPFGSDQIPACPFCIERIDVNVSGLVTSRRGWLSSGLVCSSSCVACSNLASSILTCSRCEDAKPGLWLCLLCGNVGCGRYERAHAEAHSKLSNHRLSLEIATGRIWDYVDDLFVHRRIVSQPSAPILDLPERIDPSSLPVHPQVSFDEDIRELDSTMERQLEYEKSKYEEACTQLRALGKSRVHEEEALLFKERAEEDSLRADLDVSRRQERQLAQAVGKACDTVKFREVSLSKNRRKYRELLDKMKSIQTKLSKPFDLPRARLDELDRLETEVEELRLRVSSI